MPPVGPDRQLLVQRVAEALHDAALDLPVDRARVERAADILHHAVVEDLDVTGVRIDGDVALVDGEDRHVERVDEMAHGAAGHRRRCPAR